MLLYHSTGRAISSTCAAAHGARGPGHVCFRVRADVLDALGAHLAACGQIIEADFLWPNGARSLYLRDPAGNSVEFAEPRLWSDQE